MPSHNDEREKNPEYVARGFKAAIHNPNVSEEAKNRAAQQLKEMGVTPPAISDTQQLSEAGESNDSDQFEEADYNPNTSLDSEGSKNENRVLGGYKATLKNPRISEEAKREAEKILDEHDAL